MRFELAGTLVRPSPQVITFANGAIFVPKTYLDMGYTNFDVICIGASGGKGGGINTAASGTNIRSSGGAGGGGGLHRVHGLLSALPASCPVVVGSAGVFGKDHSSDPGQTTDGGDGGYSSFNAPTCQASGGKGGKQVQTNSVTDSTLANGGAGGIGGSIVAGGGATGGTAGTPSATGPGVAGTSGNDGGWDGTIGQGGGGGAGGVGLYGTKVTCNAATGGGAGSFDAGDLLVYGPPGLPSIDPASGTPNVMPGGASGAKAAPVTGLPYIYGQSSPVPVANNTGGVVIRLTAF